jgi:hypothetical protein
VKMSLFPVAENCLLNLMRGSLEKYRPLGYDSVKSGRCLSTQPRSPEIGI